MRRWHGVVLFTVAWMLASAAVAGEADTLARLDEALKAVATYEHGGDSAPLRTVADIVIAVAKDPKQREAVEQRLLRTLASATTRGAKDFLCRQLRTIGTARCVPALEAMLTEPKLAHMARYALGRIEDPAALAAIHRALGRTSGKLQIGVINTLADRHCEKARPDLVKLLGSPDAQVAEAAAAALGKLGGTASVNALEAARGKAPESVRAHIDHALLACAGQLLAAGHKAEAARLYERFYAPKAPRQFRLGALCGLVAARGEASAALLVEAIQGDDPQLQATAIGLAASVEGRQATATLVRLLPTLKPQAQELLLGALGRRGDRSAAQAVAAAAKSEHEAVRVAALEALGSVGDASAAGPLVQLAASAGGLEQQVARRSLARLSGDDVDAVLIKAVGAGEAKVRVEIIRALAGRGTRKAVGALLEVATDGDPAVRREAIRALGSLAGEADLNALVALAVKPKDPKDRSAVEQAVAAAFRRVKDPEKQAAPVLAALAGAPADAKPTLMHLLGRAATPKALEAVRAALKDPDAAIQDAAVRTLAEWSDATPAEELLALARTAASRTHKVLALRGYVRMAGMSANPTAMYARAIQLAERPEDKKLVLAGLGTADTTEALALVEQHLKDDALRNEAAMAAIQIADRLRQKDAKRARAALASVLAAVAEPAVRQKAQDVVNDMEKFDGHIVAWLGAGPYKQKGKDARALFDTAFPPEQPDAKDVGWKKLTKGVGSWSINLESAIASGDNCVAYVRTSVWSPTEQDVRLEMGSDDALKVWLNGEVVHANNGDRSCAPRQDLVKAKLQKGWNALLLKVVEHTGGWGFCCRIRKPDGSALDGLKYEAK